MLAVKALENYMMDVMYNDLIAPIKRAWKLKHCAFDKERFRTDIGTPYEKHAWNVNNFVRLNISQSRRYINH